MSVTDYRNTVIYTDAMSGLRILIDAGTVVNQVISSPPFWGLKAYLDDDHPMKRYEIGTEDTPEEYIENLVGVFRLVRELLAPDGSIWINTGDTKAGSGGPGGDYSPGGKREGQRRWKRKAIPLGRKRKDLCMIPARLAEALCLDGWYLISEIVWSKPVTLPDSAKDRPTRSHEMIYMLTKNPVYYYNWDAATKQLSTVWEIPADRTTGNHHAKMPQGIPERAIYAATSEMGHCASCGKGWKRKDNDGSTKEINYTQIQKGKTSYPWEPTCDCKTGWKPALVLDPFCGSGTVLRAAECIGGRHWLGIELCEDYRPLIEERTAQRGLFG